MRSWVPSGRERKKIICLPRFVLGGAAATDDSPYVLMPKNPKLMLDSEYILFAIGLLSHDEPSVALRIIKKYLHIL